ncbi:lytic transglycosylase domain-containing protein [Kordiimonas laminariae]|uniref:lytic transglycosylase domain-containing protein n=1 Tax=Kordiimonas laminariae TaxID=2917717 RepID=UPI001FF53E74|nr:lytic transglycosylase domain-containing protein [Kordiimonas laminariae]MCK0068592.1 transglycosylase SLT domain-containing protein [Kordiimonas laminariae]
MRMFKLAFSLALTLNVFIAGTVYAAENTTIPKVLSNEDISRYQRIFELQEQGQWKKADRLIKGLDNDILMGHVQYQRYMHPRKYRSRYGELAGWLKRYADHPKAWAVYRLAKKRQGRARAPRRPVETRYPGVTGQSAKAKPPVPRRTRLERRAVSKFLANVRKQVRRGNPERAEKRFWAMEKRGLAAPHELAAALERISASYYYKGNDFKALKLSTLGANLAREIEPTTDWIAGLSNWRLGNYDQAYEHFSILGESERASDWLLSAGQFWAGRTAFRMGDSYGGTIHLKNASDYSETFYGLIAGRQLGIKPEIDWTVPTLSNTAMANLLQHPATRRALALMEVSRNDVADEELRLLWGRKGTAVQDDLLALAANLNLPAIQTRLARASGTGKLAPTSTRYPLPDWQPAGGFSIDRALLFAMVRKESDFRSRAKSRAGAGGLMQVMPATARFISRKGSKLLRRNRHRLFEPEFNMALGQQYISHLLDMEYVDGNLFMALAAYNGGPGSLLEWRKEVPYQQDPLLFIESIGFYETRDYIERVMANLWLYRMRLGQETPSLDAVASGAWPAFDALDTPETVEALQRAVTLTAEGQTLRAEN